MSEDSQTEIADRLSRRRALVMPLLALVFLSGQAIYALGRVEPGSMIDRAKVAAWVAWALALLALLAMGGGTFRGRAIRKLMDDESSRANRNKAYAVGFWLAMGTTITIYALTAFDTIAPRESLHVIVTITVAGALVTFGYLERRDHLGG
jgi:FtsH-binding integral membrane protein